MSREGGADYGRPATRREMGPGTPSFPNIQNAPVYTLPFGGLCAGQEVIDTSKHVIAAGPMLTPNSTISINAQNQSNRHELVGDSREITALTEVTTW